MNNEWTKEKMDNFLAKKKKYSFQTILQTKKVYLCRRNFVRKAGPLAQTVRASDS